MGVHEVMELGRGLVRISDHPSLRNSFSRLVGRGKLLRVLPGVVMDPGLQGDMPAWMRAVGLWDPDAVIAGRAAASLTFSPGTEVATIPVYSQIRLGDRGPLRFRSSLLPPEETDWVEGHRVTKVVATALTAGLEGDFEPGTHALRTRLIKPMAVTAVADKWGQRVPSGIRRVEVELSRNPWSVAELEVHRLLVRGGVTGWVANPRVVVGDKVFHPDIAILRSKIAFEVNSFAHHSSKTDMERDSSRLNQLLSVGWRVYSIVPQQARDYPDETLDFVRSVVWSQHRKGTGRGVRIRGVD